MTCTDINFVTVAPTWMVKINILTHLLTLILLKYNFRGKPQNIIIVSIKKNNKVLIIIIRV